MGEVIQVLLIILLVGGIGAVVRLFLALGDLRRVLGNVETTLETTRKDVDATLMRLNTVAESTDKVLREEIAPTLQVLRQTVSHVEVTTRAIADTSRAARQLIGAPETSGSSGPLKSVGNVVAQFAAKQATSLAIGLLSRVGSSVAGLFGRRKPPGNEIIQVEDGERLPDRPGKNGGVSARSRSGAAARRGKGG